MRVNLLYDQITFVLSVNKTVLLQHRSAIPGSGQPYEMTETVLTQKEVEELKALLEESQRV